MALPPYSRDVYWKEYEISTPTFDLTPIEKPDMSPFLFHMTGKREIAGILRGDGSDESHPEEHGYLAATVPADAAQEGYSAKVVCLTESPVFALDFFRYRKYSRWEKNHMYGIGFSKSRLADAGARPCVYSPAQMNDDINYLYKLLCESGDLKALEQDKADRLHRLLDGLYRANMPLLEEKPAQGFSWEREWRFIEESGFSFPYSDICIICCPREEEEEIRNLLGPYSENVQFVQAWIEYDAVTDFLRRHNRGLDEQRDAIDESDPDAAKKLERVLVRYKTALNSLESFISSQDQLNKLRLSAEQKQDSLEEIVKALEAQIEGLKEDSDGTD